VGFRHRQSHFQSRPQQTQTLAAQDPWEFWEHIRDHVVHIHVKDATWNPAKNDADYNWPGEGKGRVRDILKDAFSRGYDAGISIEPHMVVVFHDANSKTNNEDAMREILSTMEAVGKADRRTEKRIAPTLIKQ
jgi:sugar phosphate isomerase/epimerase